MRKKLRADAPGPPRCAVAAQHAQLSEDVNERGAATSAREPRLAPGLQAHSSRSGPQASMASGLARRRAAQHGMARLAAGPANARRPMTPPARAGRSEDASDAARAARAQGAPTCHRVRQAPARACRCLRPHEPGARARAG
jgi:hypothetical protein